MVPSGVASSCAVPAASVPSEAKRAVASALLPQRGDLLLAGGERPAHPREEVGDHARDDHERQPHPVEVRRERPAAGVVGAAAARGHGEERGEEADRQPRQREGGAGREERGRERDVDDEDDAEGVGGAARGREDPADGEEVERHAHGQRVGARRAPGAEAVLHPGVERERSATSGSARAQRTWNPSASSPSGSVPASTRNTAQRSPISQRSRILRASSARLDMTQP